ncbi:12986_t:CDS:2 [Cetraspora pellucida]|uniref:12986_t:CDS:1 n=1 Tax=Cetraspora pellucida TaxID=1433469 RepID=A0ACA9MBA9_9GLOM|nr:12986_t:CDS:2 [Cetraspora pellucida]
MEKGLQFFINKVYVNDYDKKEAALQLYPLFAEQCHGDIRLAINTLQFLMVEAPVVPMLSNRGARANSHKKFAQGSQGIQKRRITNSKRSILDSTLRTLFDSVTCNELITDPFKAIGRILYNRRTEDSNDEAHKKIQQKINSLQEKLVHPREIRERMPLMYAPESTLDNMSMEYHKYLCFLRHYYPHFYGNILECQFASEFLSDAELLMNNQNFKVGIKLTPTAAILASRGLLFAHIQKKKPLLSKLPSLKDFREHILNERLKNEDKFDQYFQRESTRRLTCNVTWITEIVPLMGKMAHGLQRDNLRKQFLKEVASYDKSWV